MSSFRSLAAALLMAAAGAQAQPTAMFAGIGREATPQELAAWDTDVRADFKGLPAGSGTVARGMVIWEAQCASCHGVFGESNEVFQPITGGTSKADIRSGRVARLQDAGFPGRTTLMKLSTLSTLWDYIQRAMPWNQPRSLSVDDTYAVTAYILHLGGVVPDGFTLSQDNVAQVQQQLPNRNGMTLAHAMWPGRMPGAVTSPDVKATACMTRCGGEPVVASSLPEHARNAHGNLAEQNRLVGAQVGADTTQPMRTAASRTAPAATAAAPKADPTASTAVALLRKHNCLACHGVDGKVVGPALREVSRKHAGRPDVAEYLGQRIVGGSTGVWGAIPMLPQALPAADVKAIAAWLADGARNP